MGVQHEDINLRAARHAINSRRPRIARGCPNNGQMRIAFGQKSLKQLAQQLQSHVFERQCWPVEQLHQPLLAIQLDKRRNSVMRKSAIGSRAEPDECGLVQIVRHKGAHYGNGSLNIRQAPHRGNFIARKAGPAFRHIKPAVRRKPCERCAFEIERRGAPSGADIPHDGWALALLTGGSKLS